MEKMMVTVAEAAKMCSVSYHVIADWCETEDNFPVTKIGNKRIIEVNLLRQWLQDRCKARVGMESARVMRVLRRSKQRREAK